MGAEAAPGSSDPTRIPFNLVTEIGSHIGVALDAEEVGTASAERVDARVRDRADSGEPS